METVNSFHKQNKNISSSVLLCSFKTHANNSWGHTCMSVNRIGCCLFPSQSPCSRLLKLLETHLQSCTKRCICLKLLVWREPLFILTHWCLKEIARNPSLIPWRFLEYFRASESTKINGMCSNHRHKIRFQDVVY